MIGSVMAAAVPMSDGTRGVLLTVFLVFLTATLLFCLFVGPEKDQVDAFYGGGGRRGPFVTVLALVGVCLPTSTVLGTTGTISLSGYDGMFITLSVLLSLALLLVLAKPLRHHGRFTIGDVFARWGRAPRVAAGIVALAVCLPLLMFELASVGLNTALLFGLTGSGARLVFTIMIGVLIISATAFGGMRCATALQVVKGILLFAACAVVVVLVMKEFHFSLGSLLQGAQSRSSQSRAFVSQGLSRDPWDSDAIGTADFVGLQMTIILGMAAMPHVVMQVNTLSDNAAAATAVRRAMHVVAAFAVGAIVVGLGATALVGREQIAAVDPGGASALLLLSASLGGGTMTSLGATVFILVACALFVTVLAATASVTLAAAAALAHDIYRRGYGDEKTHEGSEVTVARWAATGMGTAATALAVAARDQNIQQLTTLSLAVAASSLLPALVYSLFWSGYTRPGLLWTLYGGMGTTVILLLFSPAFSGTPSALFPARHLDWFPLESVGLVSVPISFLLGYLVSVLGGADTGGSAETHERPPSSASAAR